MDKHMFSTVRALSATDRSSQPDSGTECLEEVNHAGSLALSAASPVPPDVSQSKSSKRSGLFPWWAQDLHYDPSVSPRVERLTPNIQPEGCSPLYAAHGRTVASDRKAVHGDLEAGSLRPVHGQDDLTTCAKSGLSESSLVLNTPMMIATAAANGLQPESLGERERGALSAPCPHGLTSVVARGSSRGERNTGAQRTTIATSMNGAASAGFKPNGRPRDHCWIRQPKLTAAHSLLDPADAEPPSHLIFHGVRARLV